MTNCPTCSGKVSANAPVCPHCGEPTPGRKGKNDVLGTLILLVLAAAVMLFVFVMPGYLYFLRCNTGRPWSDAHTGRQFWAVLAGFWVTVVTVSLLLGWIEHRPWDDVGPWVYAAGCMALVPGAERIQQFLVSRGIE